MHRDSIDGRGSYAVAESLPNLGVIDEEAGVVIDLAPDRHLNAEAVSVKTAAFVTVRHLREKMRGLEQKIMRQFDIHSVGLEQTHSSMSIKRWRKGNYSMTL